VYKVYKQKALPTENACHRKKKIEKEADSWQTESIPGPGNSGDSEKRQKDKPAIQLLLSRTWTFLENQLFPSVYIYYTSL
jgi:hypothetical protein